MPDWWNAIGGTPSATAPPSASADGGEDVAGYIRSAAAKRGIDPEVAIRVAQSEGGLEPARRGTFKTGSSWYPFQLHWGGKGYEHLGTTAGMGNSFTAQTGYQPGDPTAWKAATDYALDAAAKNGWGAWYGARNIGVTGYQGINRNAPAAPAPAAASVGPSQAWWQGVPGARDFLERPGPSSERKDIVPAGQATPERQPYAAGAAPEWHKAIPGGAAPGPGEPGGRSTAALPPDQVARQSIAANWALSQLGSKDFYNLCQRFIEQAYGTGGQYGSAAAAGKALFKTANPQEADAGDLVFFRPDASNGFAGHAAIYLGNGEMVGATNGGVTRDRIDSPYWSKLLVGFGDPPAAWKGRSGGSTAALERGATQLVGQATPRAPSTAAPRADWMAAV